MFAVTKVTGSVTATCGTTDYYSSAGTFAGKTFTTVGAAA